MKAVKLFFAYSLFLAATSCMEKLEDRGENPDLISVSYENIKPYDTYEVVAKPGYVAYAICNADTIASTTVTTTVLVPQLMMSDQSRAAGDVQTVYKELDSSMSQESLNTQYDYCVLMFEDTPKGDHDYNDLIIHINQVRANGKWTLAVQPIAMGNTRKLKFGADMYLVKKSDKSVERACRIYISNDVKAEYFKESSTTTMINTFASGEPRCLEGYALVEKVQPVGEIMPLDDNGTAYTAINYESKSTTSFLPVNSLSYFLYQNWFIETESGSRYYAVPSYYKGTSNWIDEKGYPMGIYAHGLRTAFRDKNNKDIGGKDWMYYPKESTSIDKVFNGFTEWLTGGNIPDWNNPNEGTYIDAIKNYSTGNGTNEYYYSLYNTAKELWTK